MFNKEKSIITVVTVKLVFSFSLIIAMVIISYAYLIYSYQRGTLENTQRLALIIIILVVVLVSLMAYMVILDLRKFHKVLQKEHEMAERWKLVNDANPIRVTFWDENANNIATNIAA